jgi:hypothetical protein
LRDRVGLLRPTLLVEDKSSAKELAEADAWLAKH